MWSQRTYVQYLFILVRYMILLMINILCCWSRNINIGTWSTVEPRYNKVPIDWQNLFAIPRLGYIKILFHIIFYRYWGQENRSLYRGLCYIEVCYIVAPLYMTVTVLPGRVHTYHILDIFITRSVKSMIILVLFVNLKYSMPAYNILLVEFVFKFSTYLSMA